jgi:hypothetical protein
MYDVMACTVKFYLIFDHYFYHISIWLKKSVVYNSALGSCKLKSRANKSRAIGRRTGLKKKFKNVKLFVPIKVKVKVKQSRYRPGVAQRVPGS